MFMNQYLSLEICVSAKKFYVSLIFYPKTYFSFYSLFSCLCQFGHNFCNLWQTNTTNTLKLMSVICHKCRRLATQCQFNQILCSMLKIWLCTLNLHAHQLYATVFIFFMLAMIWSKAGKKWPTSNIFRLKSKFKDHVGTKYLLQIVNVDCQKKPYQIVFFQVFLKVSVGHLCIAWFLGWGKLGPRKATIGFPWIPIVPLNLTFEGFLTRRNHSEYLMVFIYFKSSIGSCESFLIKRPKQINSITLGT